jgi:hypothetical protein
MDDADPWVCAPRVYGHFECGRYFMLDDDDQRLIYFQLLRRRLPPRRVKGNLIDLSQFKNLAFSVYTVCSVTAFLGLYTGV